MGAHRLHDQVRYLAGSAYPFVEQIIRQAVGLEVGQPAGSLPVPLAGAVAQVEASRMLQALVEIVEAGNGVADQVADTTVVGHQPVPVHRCCAEGGGSDTGDHRRLRAHLP
ncbi:hypothetical protein D3C80_1639140 [compost metagenome]